MSTYDSHPHMIVIWTNYFFKKELLIRIINSAPFLAHTDPLFFANGILKIHDIHRLNIGLYMYQHHESAQYLRSQAYHTRGQNELLAQSARLTMTQNSISVFGPNIWNTIPEEIRNSPSLNSFKFKYKKFLLSFYVNNENWPTHLFYFIHWFYILVFNIFFR